jgi:hypothetical protein
VEEVGPGWSNANQQTLDESILFRHLCGMLFATSNSFVFDHVVGLQVLDHAKTTKFECNKITWSSAHVLAGKGKFVEIPLRWFIYVCFFVLSAVCECVCAPCK